MPDQLQLRGGTTSEHNSFTGAAREVTVDTTKKTLVVHDGTTAGGKPLMRESGGNSATSVAIGSGGTNAFSIDTNQDITFTGLSANAVWDKSNNSFNFVDNAKVIFGTGNDLTIRHDATNSYIENTTGNLYIDTANTNQSINFRVGGSTTQLLLESSAITTPSGVLLNVSGDAAFHGNVDLHDNDNLRIGSGDDLKIYHDGTNSYIWNDTGDLRIFSGSGSDPTTESINCKANGHTSLYYDGAEKAFTHANGFKLNDDKILLIGTGNDLKFSHNSTVENSYIQNDTGYLYIDTVNNVYIRNDSGVDTAVFDHTNGCYLKYQGNTKLNTTTAGVTVTGAVTESSDIALKSNIEPLTNVLDKINQITGYKYNFTSNNSSSMGVIAQDVEKVFPELVHGEEGSKSLQYSGLIGALIESIKELSAKVSALENS